MKKLVLAECVYITDVGIEVQKPSFRILTWSDIAFLENRLQYLESTICFFSQCLLTSASQALTI